MTTTDTPRTDAIADQFPQPGQPPGIEWPEIVPADTARELERELTQWQAELSKVMPPDFKDWWQNSKAEWPLVARLVIEGKNRERAAADEYTARIERELAESIKLRGFIEQAAAELEEDKEYNARLCDTLREELEQERALADRLADALAVYKGDAEHLEHWMPGPAQIKASKALAAWKGARHE